MTQNMYYYEYASNGLLLKEREELSDGTVKIYEYNYQEFYEQENWIKREAEITDENGAEIMKQIQTREITYYEQQPPGDERPSECKIENKYKLNGNENESRFDNGAMRNKCACIG